jgi:hypothetical protein
MMKEIPWHLLPIATYEIPSCTRYAVGFDHTSS